MASVSRREGAKSMDRQDALSFTRDEFVIPTKADIRSTRLAGTTTTADSDHPKETTEDRDRDQEKCTYLCGNSLGLQPKRTAARLQQYLATWATLGVHAHTRRLEGSPLPPWLDADDRAAEMMAPVVGARGRGEVNVMQTLTGNLHLLMSAFYRPDVTMRGRHKIILESKAFPSDHFAVETQIRHHNLDPATSMVLVTAPFSDDPVPSTYDVLSVISQHAASAALVLLPGVQYYTGQLLDIPTITAFAHKHGVPVVWDLAHAVGNVPLRLHDWDVDAAAWCSYKYLNGGPGCIGGMFVHERHGAVAGAATLPEDDDDDNDRGNDDNDEGSEKTGHGCGYAPGRLAGWWGNDKRTRFEMATASPFRPAPGAAGFQLSNPSVADATALCASLEVFAEAGGVAPLRDKSVRLTGFLEKLLLRGGILPPGLGPGRGFRIVTPADPDQRGAQLSLLLLRRPGADGEGEGSGEGAGQEVLDAVMAGLDRRGVVVDERRPNVVRVAPAPLYNTFEDCVDFVEAFGAALAEAWGT